MRGQAQFHGVLTYNQMILGLTGSMGGGKSTAARFFVQKGFRLLDADRIVREELLTVPDVIAKIAARFPAAVSAQNVVERPVLAGYVFSNIADRLWLEELLHPMIYSKWREAIAGAPNADWVVEAPLLFEQNLENWFDFTVCVATSSANQLVRLIERGITQSLAEQRISTQLPLFQKIEKADFVLSNDGTPEALRMQVEHLTDHLRRTNTRPI
jgi:dephospho-CoA kinase